MLLDYLIVHVTLRLLFHCRFQQTCAYISSRPPDRYDAWRFGELPLPSRASSSSRWAPNRERRERGSRRPATRRQTPSDVAAAVPFHHPPSRAPSSLSSPPAGRRAKYTPYFTIFRPKPNSLDPARQRPQRPPPRLSTDINNRGVVSTAIIGGEWSRLRVLTSTRLLRNRTLRL